MSDYDDAPPPAWGWLTQKFPAVFNDAKSLPLAVGCHEIIFADAATDGISEDDARSALMWHTNSTRYLRAMCVEGAFRHNLDGTPVSEVSPVARGHAMHTVTRRAGVMSHLQEPKVTYRVGHPKWERPR
jgi:sRNA-binding protein